MSFSWLRGKIAQLQSWTRDRLLARVVRNSSYLFASYAIGAVLTIVTARLLGAAEFGILGTVTVLVTNINRLFSFRMGETVVKYMGDALARDDQQRAAAVVKMAFLTEACTSIIAYGVLALVTPLGVRYFTKETGSASLFLIYGLSILTNGLSEASLGVLQVTNHYRSQALINLVQTILVAILLGLAAVYQANLMTVLEIYLIGKAILGIGPALVAFYWIPRVLGKDWLRAPLSFLPPIRELARFSVSTNLNGSVTMLARDSELPIINFFFGPSAAGYYKIALALINLIVQPINPFISTTYPEITRTFANHEWPRLKKLLQRVSMIAAAWTGAVAIGLALFGRPLLFQSWTFFGLTVDLLSEYAPAYPVVMILLVGYGAANILFWNRPLLLAQGQAGFPLKVSFWALLVKLLLTIVLFPSTSYWVAAALLSGYLLVTVTVTAVRGLQGISQIQRPLPQSEPL